MLRQPLPAALHPGQPVLVGQRLFVPLYDKPVAANERPRRDESGVILEIEAASGYLLGRISLGRPLGGPIIARAAEFRDSFSVPPRPRALLRSRCRQDRMQADGLQPRPGESWAFVCPRDTPPGSLRGEPIITPGEGDQSGFLILGLTGRSRSDETGGLFPGMAGRSGSRSFDGSARSRPRSPVGRGSLLFLTPRDWPSSPIAANSGFSASSKPATPTRRCSRFRPILPRFPSRAGQRIGQVVYGDESCFLVHLARAARCIN